MDSLSHNITSNISSFHVGLQVDHNSLALVVVSGQKGDINATCIDSQTYFIQGCSSPFFIPGNLRLQRLVATNPQKIIFNKYILYKS